MARMIGGPYALQPGSVARASIAIISLMFLALVSVLGVWLVSSYQATAKRADTQVSAASKIVAANAVWLNSLARETLHRIDDSLGTNVLSVDPQRVHDLNAAVADLPPQVTAYVVGVDGVTRFSNDPKIQAMDVSDREYFTRLQNGADEYTSALIVSRLTKRQIFVVSRRLERNGNFAGVAAIAFNADVLKPIWDSVDMGPNSTVSFLRRDGRLIARHPEPPGPIDMGGYILFTDYMKKATSGIYRSYSPVDNEDRLVGYRIIERTPFIAIASADVGILMQPFWDDAKIAALLVIFAVVGAIAAAHWIQRLIREDALHTRQLAEALTINQTLMREIHHRVKNNLQTVMALLRMQGFEPSAVQRLNERITAMSAVHEQMYGFDQFSGVSAAQFVPSFVKKIVDVHGRSIRVTFDVQDLNIAPDRATPFALLLNELIANSMKYAFAGRQAGTIHVRLRAAADGVAELSVVDDGVGFDGNSNKPGMGTRLIKAFVQQLAGEFRFIQNEGTIFTASLRLTDLDG